MQAQTPVWSRYLGEPWTPAFDCWALIRAVYLDELNVDLPYTGIAPETLFKSLRKIATHPIRKQFVKVTEPQHLAIAEFNTETSMPFHMGVYVETEDGPMILHNPRGGVVLDCPSYIDSPITYWIYSG